MSLQFKAITQQFRHAVHRRPISSLVAGTSATAFGYASYIEWNATKNSNASNNTNTNECHGKVLLQNGNHDDPIIMQSIPRHHYDPHAIANYWEQRPISVMKRILGIALELAPVAGEYLMTFHVQPWMQGHFSNTFGMVNTTFLSKISNNDAAVNDATFPTSSSSTSYPKAQCDTAQMEHKLLIDDALLRVDETQHHEQPQQHHHEQSTIIERDLSQKLRNALTNLGPTFVKVGQQLSIRPDLVSPIVLQELQRLCDAVPPFEDAIAMKVLAEELLKTKTTMGSSSNEDFVNIKDVHEEDIVNTIILDVFEEVPKLVASASLGQVYKATLRSSNTSNGVTENKSEMLSNEKKREQTKITTTPNSKDKKSSEAKPSQQVAIKIQRPDIFETVTMDLFLLVTYGKVADKLFSIITHQLPYHEPFLNGFAQGAFMELNYYNEAENQMYFRKEFGSRFSRQTSKHVESNSSGMEGGNPGGSWYQNYNFGLNFLRSRTSSKSKQSSAKVIVPYVYEQYTTQSILVTEWIDGIPLAQAPKEQIRELIPVGVELFLCQLLDMGRFHADPHPGNLYVTTSSDGKPTLCLLDFGLVAHVDENASRYLTSAILHLLQGDYDTLIAHDAKHLGFLPHDMDVTELQPLLKTILKEGLVDSGSNLHDRRRNLMAISKELNEVFFRYPFSVPPFFALVTRGLGLLEGIALSG